MEHIKIDVAVIIAHPDDETLWTGGAILDHTDWNCFIVCLCRKNDSNRSSKFFKALEIYGCKGIMGDLDDGIDQKILTDNEVKRAILNLLPLKHFDLIITHNPTGEYTKHLRHEEISKAVIRLWNTGKVSTSKLWLFAYEDGMKQYYPKPVEKATIYHLLPEKVWHMKYNIITNVYGFDSKSWEAETTPKAEAFWEFFKPADAIEWLEKIVS